MQSQAPECSVIIPVFNKWELTSACLASLREHTAAHDLEVIVVDNGSSDATAAELASYGAGLFGERFSALVFAENRNFGPACNAGAHAATAPILLFLNNDTLMTPDWLPPLLKAMHEGDPSTAVGPLLLYEDGSVQHMGVAYGLQGPTHLYRGFPADHPVVGRKRTLQAITGAAFMIRKEFFRDCGEFHEGYRNGYEDIDLCVAIRRRGGTVRCITASRVYHLESRTPGRKNFERFNSLLFTRRCRDAIFVDLHHHALRDGFAVAVNDLLTIDVTLSEEDERALATVAQERDVAAWLHLTRAHPFWIRGREVLAQEFEQRKRYAEAVHFRIELTNNDRRIPRYRDLLRLAPLVEQTPWLAKVEEFLALMARIRTDQAFAHDILRGQTPFRPEGEPMLERAFAAKLREWFPDGK